MVAEVVPLTFILIYSNIKYTSLILSFCPGLKRKPFSSEINRGIQFVNSGAISVLIFDFLVGDSREPGGNTSTAVVRIAVAGTLCGDRFVLIGRSVD